MSAINPGFDMICAASSAAATLGNVGPGFGIVSANYASVSAVSMNAI